MGVDGLEIGQLQVFAADGQLELLLSTNMTSCMANRELT
jgi:hypothetical protein